MFNKISNFLKKLKFTLLVIPDNPSTFLKQGKLSFSKISLFLSLYTIVTALLLTLLFSFTPLGSMIYEKSARLTDKNVRLLNELSERFSTLTEELVKLQNNNEKLMRAIQAGDSLGVSKLRMPGDTIKKNLKVKVGGDVFSIIKSLFFSSTFDSPAPMFIKPVRGFVTQNFNSMNGHLGIDFALTTGTPVIASANGYIVFSGYSINDGYLIIMAHSDDYITVYKHCSQVLKNQRDVITQGELIALSGNTGELSSGPHLHFEIWKRGVPIDPEKIIIDF